MELIVLYIALGVIAFFVASFYCVFRLYGRDYDNSSQRNFSKASMGEMKYGSVFVDPD